MNSLDASWLAIGHTPRGDADHIYGSVHFDAGEDVGVKLTSDRRDTSLGIRIEVVKSNDFRPPLPMYFKLEFNSDETLVSVTSASLRDFPELASAGTVSIGDKIFTYLAIAGNAAGSDIALELGLDGGNVSRALNADPRFIVNGKNGKKILWQIKESTHV